MFSDPWIIGGAGVMLTVLAIAFGVRLYNKIVNKAVNNRQNKPSS